MNNLAVMEAGAAELSEAAPPGGPAVEDRPVTVIAPPRGWQGIDLGELWRFLRADFLSGLRDVRSLQADRAGAAWALLQPALMMLVFTIFFSRMAGVASGGLPYPLFAFAGPLPWTFFATAIASAGNSVVGSERLITKIYFPRLAIPLAAVAATVVDFGIALGFLAGMMASLPGGARSRVSAVSAHFRGHRLAAGGRDACWRP